VENRLFRLLETFGVTRRENQTQVRKVGQEFVISLQQEFLLPGKVLPPTQTMSSSDKPKSARESGISIFDNLAALSNFRFPNTWTRSVLVPEPDSTGVALPLSSP